MRLASAMLLLLLCGTAHAEVPVPPLTKFATDLTGTLTPEQLLTINQGLADLEASKGAQFALLIVPTTQPEDAFHFGMRVFESWKLGRKGVDDGLLWVIAKDTGQWFILTGYGMEGILPDVKIKHIADEFITPNFRRGEGYAGIVAGASEIIKVIDKEPLPPPTGRSPLWYASVKPHDPVPIPPWTQHVIDLAGKLDPARLKALNQRLEEFEQRKGAQIGALILPTMRTEIGTQFIRRLCETWQLGRNGVDDGVTIAVSADTKEFTIIPGYGLEKALSRDVLLPITKEIFVPNLMLGEYDNAFDEGIDAIIKVVDAVPLPPPDHSLMSTLKKGLLTCQRYVERYSGAFILLAVAGVALLYRYRRRLRRTGSTSAD